MRTISFEWSVDFFRMKVLLHSNETVAGSE